MLRFALILSLVLGFVGESPAADWQPKQAPLMTRWAKDVSPDKAHPEYPRPQMIRKEWQNLNGLWDYAIRPKDDPQPTDWDGKILVPFPVESALSGVMKQVGPENRLWYRRTFKLPDDAAWSGKRILLHFGAVDWEAMVEVNGKKVGEHRGGYDPFTFDVSDALKKDGENELVVSVWDPSDAGFQPRGKQIRKPHGIWYTPTTGIWQTVWLEPVPPVGIESLVVTPDIDNERVRVALKFRGNTNGLSLEIAAEWSDNNAPAGFRYGASEGIPLDSEEQRELALSLPKPQLWSPESPFLYDLRIALRDQKQTVVDRIDSYFGMRKISLGKDDQGITRLLLNGKFLFQYGTLDQGFWPDGLYTAPTDEALKYDLEVTKRLGFNMVRKHVKVEPARWYYHCDKLGLLVWQDMPSGDKYIGASDPDVMRTVESAKQFETEWANVIKANYNAPSIVMWVPFNEGWGQYDTARITDLTKKLGSSD